MDYWQGLLFWYNSTNFQQWTVRQAASFPRQSSNPSPLVFAVLADHPHKGLHNSSSDPLPTFGPSTSVMTVDDPRAIGRGIAC